jgi:hypothetical protein
MDTNPDQQPDPQPRSDAERAAYAERLVLDTVARLDAQRNPDPPAFDLSDRVTNLVVHAGDHLYYSRHDNGAVEYRLIDQDGCHYATFHGHGDPASPGEFVIDAIAYHPSPDGGRRVLPVRPEPDAQSVPVPLTLSASVPNAVHQSGTPYHLSLTHAHQHGHVGVGGDRYTHDHPHPHAGDEFYRAGTFGHASDPHTHGH